MRIIEELKLILTEGFLKEIPDVKYTIPAGTKISLDGGKTSQVINKDLSLVNDFAVFDSHHFNKRLGERSVSTDTLFKRLGDNSLLELMVKDILTKVNSEDTAIILDETNPNDWVAYIIMIRIKEIENAKDDEYKLKSNNIKLITAVNSKSSFDNSEVFVPSRANKSSRIYWFDVDGNFKVVSTAKYRKMRHHLMFQNQ